MPATPFDTAPVEGFEMLVAVDVMCPYVGCSPDEVDFDLSGFTLGGVVGFEPVVPV